MKRIEKKYRVIFVLTGVFSILIANNRAAYGNYIFSSPDKEIKVKVRVDKNIYYSVFHKGKEVLKPAAISMAIDNDVILGKNPKITSIKQQSVNQNIYPVIRQKSREIHDNYSELAIGFAGNYSVVFRAFNEGVAYRFETRFNREIRVAAEQVEFHFGADHTVYFPEEESFFSHNERYYIKQSLSDIPADKMCSLPVLTAAGSGLKILITESDLKDYPGLWLKGNRDQSLIGKFPGYPLKTEQPRDRDVRVVEVADFIAKTNGTRTFPWRIIAIAENDGELITNQLPYLLAEPLQLSDTSWIKPGKVAWDWFNYNNVYGVDFRAGVNTATYKYYIDFASKYGIEYVILDEGWYKLGNLLDINPDLDMDELLAYAKEKNVGIILWVVWKTLDDQFNEAFDRFEKWGVKGIKVDFMQRDDQWMVNYYRRVAAEAARRHMLVDFHGSYKPSGLRRAYPNVLTREGVRGLEQAKWSDKQTPEHDVTIPFIRMVAGPMDYTPGAMLNAQEENFHPVFKRPMSMGTRCHQLAMYVVFESPLQMLADSPSNYLREPECMDFLAKVPTVWDETIVLSAQVADHVALARRSEDDWYIGAMAGKSGRELPVDFSFLKAGDYTIEYFRDGINADRCAVDYKKITKNITAQDKMKIKLADGGGWAARIYRKPKPNRGG